MVTIRKEMLVNNQIYHIYNRSIAGYLIFNNSNEFNRIYQLLKLLRFNDFHFRYSEFTELKLSSQKNIVSNLELNNDIMVEIIAYCIMPTHIHLVLKQIVDDGITKYMSKLLNSYSRYFNTKHKRNGPLWSGSFKNVLVTDDDQLLHLTRYIHLNPTSANLVKQPDDWQYSSYLEYINRNNNKLCHFKNLINLPDEQYKKFVEDRKSYQQQISLIKNLLIEDYTG